MRENNLIILVIEVTVAFSRMQEKKLGRLLVRGFTKKQLTILDSVSRDKSQSITSASKKISEEREIPLSTVKLDLKILEQLGLVRIIQSKGFKRTRMTKFGKTVLRILSNYNNPTVFTQLLDIIFRPFNMILTPR